jgi:hypothetical protein
VGCEINPGITETVAEEAALPVTGEVLAWYLASCTAKLGTTSATDW